MSHKKLLSEKRICSHKKREKKNYKKSRTRLKHEEHFPDDEERHEASAMQFNGRNIQKSSSCSSPFFFVVRGAPAVAITRGVYYRMIQDLIIFSVLSR